MERFDSLKTIIRSGKNFHVIKCLDILYGKADGSYSYLHTIHGERHILTKNLKATCSDLDFPFMLRISQSTVLNLFYVTQVLTDERKVKLSNEELIHYTIRHNELTARLNALFENNKI